MLTYSYLRSCARIMQIQKRTAVSFKFAFPGWPRLWLGGRREASDVVHGAAADCVARRPRVRERESLVRGAHAGALDEALRADDELALLCVRPSLRQQRVHPGQGQGQG